MRRMAALVLAVAAVALMVQVASLEAGAPERLAHARYVALGFDVGTGFVSETSVSPDILREEREALQRIRAAIDAWGQYEIVDRPGRAEMLIAIRKGRRGSVVVGVRTGGPAATPAGQPPPATAGELGGVQFSSPDDMLEAFDGVSGNLTWRATKPNGLQGEVPPLFEALRAEVAKAHAAKKKP
jgi:hypothetical protein